MTSRIAEAARRAAETLESRAFHGVRQGTPIERRAQSLAEAYRQGRITHPNCRCVTTPRGSGHAWVGVDPGDPAGDQTFVSVQGPDGTYRRLRNVGAVSVGLIGVAHVPEDVEPLAPSPSWLPRYRPR